MRKQTICICENKGEDQLCVPLLKGERSSQQQQVKSKAKLLVQLLFKNRSILKFDFIWNEVTFGRHFEYLIRNCKSQNIV